MHEAYELAKLHYKIWHSFKVWYGIFKHLCYPLIIYHCVVCRTGEVWIAKKMWVLLLHPFKFFPCVATKSGVVDGNHVQFLGALLVDPQRFVPLLEPLFSHV